MAARAATRTHSPEAPGDATPANGKLTANGGAHPERAADRRECCSLYHRAVELVGKRWSGAILLVLMDGPLRFSEIRQLVPEISDRLLSERLKELETEGIVERHVLDATPVRVEYGLTDKGRALEPTVRTLKSWAHSWLS